jgi:hypothetical protein
MGRKAAPKQMGVYIITIGEYFYIGSTNNFAQRKREHKSKLKLGSHPNDNLSEQYRLNGSDFKNVKMELTFPCLEKNLLIQEQAALDMFFGDILCMNLNPIIYKPLIITKNGISKEYENTVAAGKALGKKYSMIHNYLSGDTRWPAGWSGHYVGQDSVPYRRKSKKETKQQTGPIILNGIKYLSKKEAKLNSGFPHSYATLCYCINGHRNWPTGWSGNYEGQPAIVCSTQKPRKNK